MIGLAASLSVGLNRFGHIQIFMVAIYANLQRIFDMAIVFAVKHNRLPLKSSLFYRWNAMLSEEGIEVGTADVGMGIRLHSCEAGRNKSGYRSFFMTYSPISHFRSVFVSILPDLSDNSEVAVSF